MESVPTSTSSASSVTSSDGRNGGSVGASGGSEFLNLGMFGQSSGATDLLLGTGGFGGGLGNGYGNEGLANAATSSGSSAFDLNDFPSLGGGAGTVGSGVASSNGLAAALRQQQQLLAHQQMLKSGSGYRLAMSSGANAGQNFNMTTEDFPALPGAPPQSVVSATGAGGGEPGSSPLPSSGNAGFGVSSMSRLSSGASGGGGLYGIELDGGGNNPLENGSSGGGSGLLGGLGGGGIAGLTTTGSNPSSSSLGHQRSSTPSSTGGSVGVASAPVGAAAAGGGATLSGDFGLLGLLGVIRMTDADRNSLALGSDLTLLGLNLNSNDQIYSTFSGPWSENQSTKEPQYQLPMCYYMQPPALKTGHLAKFQLETLFYIFYALPKDVLQAYSAQELYTREWRYNGELKTWFMRVTTPDSVANLSNNSNAPQYLYFDVNSWERRLFNGNIQNITNGFLSEEDVRVKFPSS
jgi:CCR4-NOT transcription complex subunit 2